jgi:hypothetical protein
MILLLIALFPLIAHGSSLCFLVIITTIKSKLWDERQYVLDYFDLILIMNQDVITPYLTHIMNLCNYWCLKKLHV